MKSVSGMKVATKLSLGFGGVLALLGVVVGVAVVKLYGINEEIVDVVDNRYANVATVTDMRDALGKQAFNLRNAIIAISDPDEVRASLENVGDFGID